MAEMNPLAKAWVEALLSGKYKQGNGCLRDTNDNFCCLGVAADVLGIDEWELYLGDGVKSNVYMLKSSGYWEFLPMPIWEKLIEGALNSHSVSQQFLADMNDTEYTFEQIVNEAILPMWDEPGIDLEEHY